MGWPRKRQDYYFSSGCAFDDSDDEEIEENKENKEYFESQEIMDEHRENRRKKRIWAMLNSAYDSRESEDYSDEESLRADGCAGYDSYDENSSDEEDSDSSDWPEPAIRILLKIVSENDAHSKLGCAKSGEVKDALWDDLIVKFKSHPKFQNLDIAFQKRVNGKEGAIQYRELLKKYISISDGIYRKAQSGSVKWIYFNTLKQIVIKDPVIHPSTIYYNGCNYGFTITETDSDGRITRTYQRGKGKPHVQVLSEAFVKGETPDAVKEETPNAATNNSLGNTSDFPKDAITMKGTHIKEKYQL